MKKGMEYAGKALYGMAIMVLVCTAACWLAGIRPAVVTSGSMEPAIKTGSLILINENDREIKRGDVIAFKTGALKVAHRVVAVTGEGYVTKGDNNEKADKAIVKDDMIEGTVAVSIPAVGYAVKWLATVPGIISACAAAIGIIAIGYLIEEEEVDAEKC